MSRNGQGKAGCSTGAPGFSTVGALTAQGCQQNGTRLRNDTMRQPWMTSHTLVSALSVSAIRSNQT